MKRLLREEEEKIKTALTNTKSSHDPQPGTLYYFSNNLINDSQNV